MKLGFIGALESEINELKECMTDSECVERDGLQFYDGFINHREIIVVKCGFGKVNAGRCTQILIDSFDIDMIINTGVGGALDPKLNIGDIVLSTDVVQHDFNLSALGFKKGAIPPRRDPAFRADDGLRVLAKRACTLANKDISVFEGRIATGDQFINTREEKDRIRNEFGAMCCEMEGGAIAQVAELNSIPFLIIRAISDKADNSAITDYPTFEREAIRHCVNLEKELLKLLQL